MEMARALRQLLTDVREQTVPGITRSTIQHSSASLPTERRMDTDLFVHSRLRGGQLLPPHLSVIGRARP